MTASTAPARRAAHCQRETTFGGLPIWWSDEVLEPRPWTRVQAEWACDLLGPGTTPVVELYCGAGAIGLWCAKHSRRPLVQVDDDLAACRLAQANARRLGVATDVRCSDVRDALRPHERFELMLADPPYVPTTGVPGFRCDPRHAIDGGVDGLRGIREVVALAPDHLLGAGAVVLQVRGHQQVRAVRDLCRLPSAALVVEAMRAIRDDRALVLLRRRP
jgi:methylase of polypeptide subunit release factors